MKLQRASGTLGLLALVAIASPSAFAEEAGWYLGANVGQSRATIDDARISSSLLGAGFTSSSIADNDRDRAYKVFGGYQFNRYIGVEGGYFNLGRAGFTATTVPAGSLSGDIRVQGLNLDLVGTLPITDRFHVLGRVGANYAEASDTFTGTGLVHVGNPNPSKRDTNYKVGLGLGYALTPALTLRAELERYRIDDAVGNKGDIDVASLGLVYRFGAKSPAPVHRVMAPPPVVERVAVIAAAPPPPPVAVAPPAPPPPARATPVPLKKVTFSTDALFDFDKKVIKEHGKMSLDKLTAELRGVNIDTITVTGHTDRIGPHAYNVKLSAARAEAVKAYLVGSTAIAANKIVAVGANGSNPVTKPGQCVGNKVSKALIQCLEPDRRVDIEVSGTKL